MSLAVKFFYYNELYKYLVESNSHHALSLSAFTNIRINYSCNVSWNVSVGILGLRSLLSVSFLHER